MKHPPTDHSKVSERSENVFFLACCIVCVISFIFPWLWFAGSALLLMMLWSRTNEKRPAYTKAFRNFMTWPVGIIFCISTLMLGIVLYNRFSDVDINLTIPWL